MTGYVDGALDAEEQARVQAHLGDCAVCREQAAYEAALRQRLRSLPAPALDPALESRIRAGLRQPRRGLRWALAVAAGLAVLTFVAPGSGPVLAWQLAEDHAHCHAVRMLATAEDDGEAETPSESEAADLKQLPRLVAGLPLAGVSVCALRNGWLVMHVQYAAEGKRVSVFVLHRQPGVWASFGGHVAGSAVRLLSRNGRTVGIVGDTAADLDAFARELAA